MHSNDTRRQIALVWEEFWRAGLYDSVEILEQILYLLFLRRLDHQPAGTPDGGGRLRLTADWGPSGPDETSLRWTAFRRLADSEQFALLSDHVFPRLRVIGGPGAAYAQHLKSVRFTVPTAAALGNIVRLLDGLPRHPRPAGADPFDYVADKLARVGQRGDFYTPRHIELLMVALVAPVPGDIICSPISGSSNFLAAAAQHLLRHYPALRADPAAREHFHHRMFHAYDTDKTMLRIACLKMLLHGVKNPNIRYTNTVAQDIRGDEGRYSVILAHPSTATLPDEEGPTGRAEAVGLMVAQFVRMLKLGGRAAVVVPEYILTGHSAAARNLRRTLLYEQRLDAVIPLPRPGIETGRAQLKSLLLFTRTDRGREHDGERCVGAHSLGVCAMGRPQWTPLESEYCMRSFNVSNCRAAGEGGCDQCVGAR